MFVLSYNRFLLFVNDNEIAFFINICNSEITEQKEIRGLALGSGGEAGTKILEGMLILVP